MAAKKEKKGDPFPYVMVGACVVAVAWQFGHLWLGVALLLVPLAVALVPVLLIAVAVLVAAFCGVLYTVTLFFYQKVVRRGATYSHP
jgi:apolipoprotein N-acyltransferase